jgi:cytochrome c-type protein NapB
MRRLLKTSLALCPFLALALFVSGCESATPDDVPGRSIPDHELGLSKMSVFDTPAPAPVTVLGEAPGKNEPLPRANPEFPPLVPHEIAEMLPITREENLCVECHATVDGNKPIGPEMSPSHFTDLRGAPGKVGKEVVGARWYCVSCHVPQTDAVPLVGLTTR